MEEEVKVEEVKVEEVIERRESRRGDGEKAKEA